MWDEAAQKKRQRVRTVARVFSRLVDESGGALAPETVAVYRRLFDRFDEAEQFEFLIAIADQLTAQHTASAAAMNEDVAAVARLIADWFLRN